MRRKRSARKPKSGERRTRGGPVHKRHRSIGDARLERGLRVLSETNDIATAARAIRVSVERFKQAAKRRNVIRRQQRNWIVVRRLQRKMPIFMGGRQVAITVRSKSASL